MLMPISPEFVALCRVQVGLLTQALGASLSVVYLTQELTEGVETRLVPVMAYPETAVDWRTQATPRSLMAAVATPDSPWQLANPDASFLPAKALPDSKAPNDTVIDASGVSADWINASVHQTLPLPEGTSQTDLGANAKPPADNTSLLPDRRVVLPLMHEDVVLGLLVTERNDRPWTEWEQAQIQQIADTLAIACVLDQRHQWLEREQQQQRQLQARQHDQLDNLLHQFRNSLMALQTFGKLILKRLLPGDTNRDVAASLVRETARLRDLAQQLETAVAGTEAINLAPLSLPPAADDQQTEAQMIPGMQQEAQTLALLPAAGFLAGVALPLVPCSVMTVLEPLCASATAIAQERSLTLHTDIAADLPPIQANVQVLREVLSNAIDNALKYTPAGGHVLVQVRLEEEEQEPEARSQKPEARGAGSTGKAAGNRSRKSREHQLTRNDPAIANVRAATPSFLNIAITDTGPGIPPQDLPHIFERRYRGVQTQTEIPGSGLGLSIARDLVMQMHGKIQVLSPALLHNLDRRLKRLMRTQGSGTTVVIGLPIAKTAQAETA